MVDGKQFKSFTFTDAESTSCTEAKLRCKYYVHIVRLTVELVFFLEFEK